MHWETLQNGEKGRHISIEKGTETERRKKWSEGEEEEERDTIANRRRERDGSSILRLLWWTSIQWVESLFILRIDRIRDEMEDWQKGRRRREGKISPYMIHFEGQELDASILEALIDYDVRFIDEGEEVWRRKDWGKRKTVNWIEMRRKRWRSKKKEREGYTFQVREMIDTTEIWK